MAVLLRDLVAGSEIVAEVEIGEELRALGWEIFVGYKDQVLSFTDCASFALIRERTILEAFTFDTDFLRAGFIALPADEAAARDGTETAAPLIRSHP